MVPQGRGVSRSVYTQSPTKLLYRKARRHRPKAARARTGHHMTSDLGVSFLARGGKRNLSSRTSKVERRDKHRQQQRCFDCATLDDSTTAGAGTARDRTAIHLGRRDSARLGGERLSVCLFGRRRAVAGSGFGAPAGSPRPHFFPGFVFSCPYQNICSSTASKEPSIAQARLLPFLSGKKIPALVGLSIRRTTQLPRRISS